MGTQVDHLEVAPRMWDKTLAASYMPNSSPTDSSVPADPNATSGGVSNTRTNTQRVPNSPRVSFFSRFRAYLIPAIFIICLLIVAYILWKYFTKYRNSKIANGECAAMKCPNADNSLSDPITLIQSEDMSKYEIDSDDEGPDDTKRVRPSRPSRLPTLLELKEDSSASASEDGNSSEEEGDTDDNTDDNTEEKDENPEEPDIAQIERLIMNSGDNGDEDVSRLVASSMVDEEDTFTLRMPSYITEITEDVHEVPDMHEVPDIHEVSDDVKSVKRQPREPRKVKRVTL